LNFRSEADMVLHRLVEFTTVESTVVLRQPRPRFFPS
jgi:hypothetical protein